MRERTNFEDSSLFRTGFDTKYVVLNDEDTGLISFIGEYKINVRLISGRKFTKIEFDEEQNVWIIRVMTNPKLTAIAFAPMSSNAIGEA